MGKVLVKKKKKTTNECDGGCCVDAAMSTGMGTAVPLVSGDKWDNVLGESKPKRKMKIRKKKK